jgi:hypothetical protein
MPKKLKQKGKPEVHKDLKGFDIRVNSFGEIESDMDLAAINRFLDNQEKKESLSRMKTEEE